MKHFLAGLEQGVVRVQCCTRCGARQAPAGHVCRRCANPELSWIAVEEAGTIEGVTTIHRGAEPRFAEMVPFSLAIVRFGDGLRLMGHVRNDTAIGLGVRPRVAEVAGRPGLRFEPCSTPQEGNVP